MDIVTYGALHKKIKETGGGTADNKIFYVNFTATYPYTLNGITYDEILQAYNAGEHLIGRCAGIDAVGMCDIPLIKCDSAKAFHFSFVSYQYCRIYNLTVNSDNSVVFTEKILQAKDEMVQTVADLSDADAMDKYPSAKAVLDYVNSTMAGGDGTSNVKYALNEATGELTVYGSNSTTDEIMEMPWMGNIDTAKVQSVTVLDGIAHLGFAAFAECVNLKSISLPESLSAIGLMTFMDCSSLEKLKIPSNVENFNADILGSGCAGLKKIVCSTLIQSFEAKICEQCAGLTEFVLPYDGVAEFDNSAMSDEAFTAENCVLYVPSAQLSNYQADTDYSSFFKSILSIEDNPSCMW